MTNTLFYGDNLDILRRHIPDASVDLIYLDPPFNSNRSYNVLFKEASGELSDGQIVAFDDTWHWGATSEAALAELNDGAPAPVVNMINAIVGFVGRNDVTAYLVMMTIRLVELHRVLKPTGSIYLHCDPTASHYLKVVMDTVFGPANFRSEVIWKRTSAHSSADRYGPIHDTILYYRKSQEFIWNRVYQSYDTAYAAQAFSRTDNDGRRWKSTDLTGAGVRYGETGLPWRGINVTAKGRHWAYVPAELDKLDASGRVYWPGSRGGMPRLKQYLDEMSGVPLQDIWIDIPPIGAQAAERLGYPTQKPLALLERIIQASSNPGDVVLDPFCGCGTAVVAAHKLGRRWLGIDITHLAVGLMRSRLHDMFGADLDYQMIGAPVDVASARALAEHDRHEFEHWALGLVPARSAHPGKKGADGGIDGELTFQDTARGRYKRVIIQVKSGKVQRNMVGDLAHAMRREKAELAFLVTLEPPTGPMLTEALAVGYYDSAGWGKRYQRVQIRTVEQLLAGEGFDYPPANMTFARAERVAEVPDEEQGRLGL